MSAKKRVNPKEAEDTLIILLQEIVTLNKTYCDAIDVTRHDMDMAIYVISLLNTAGDSSSVIHRNDILHDPETTEWASRFLRRKGKGKLKTLLMHAFLHAQENGTLGMIPKGRQDRHPPILEHSRRMNQMRT